MSSTSEGLRVQKIIAETGMASRREAEEWVRMGDVTINGKRAILGDKAIPGVDHIKVNGKLLKFGHKRIVVAFYKPRGVLAHRTPNEKDPRVLHDGGTIFEYLRHIKERVFPVGQLDKDAEGLLLLTNDGELAQRLNQERYEIAKVYKVKIDGHLDEKRVKRLTGRFKVEEKSLKLLDLRPLKELEGKQWVRVKITNTQNRIVRKMFEAVGRPVDKVRRMSFGGISLNGLERGQFRYLTNDETTQLYNFVGLENKSGK